MLWNNQSLISLENLTKIDLDGYRMNIPPHFFMRRLELGAFLDDKFGKYEFLNYAGNP